MTKQVSSRKMARSKFGADIMYRLWDDHNSCWITSNSRSIWSTQRSVDNIRDRLITEGRDPNTLIVERVFVSLILE